MAHIRLSRPDSGLGFQAKSLKTFQAVRSSIGSGVFVCGEDDADSACVRCQKTCVVKTLLTERADRELEARADVDGEDARHVRRAEHVPCAHPCSVSTVIGHTGVLSAPSSTVLRTHILCQQRHQSSSSHTLSVSTVINRPAHTHLLAAASSTHVFRQRTQALSA